MSSVRPPKTEKGISAISTRAKNPPADLYEEQTGMSMLTNSLSSLTKKNEEENQTEYTGKVLSILSGSLSSLRKKEDINQLKTTTNSPEDLKIPKAQTFDQRLLFAFDAETGKISTSLNSALEEPLTDGMMLKERDEEGEYLVSWKDFTKDNLLNEFYGVPSIMNENAYVNLQACGGKLNNRYLFDSKDGKRWYNSTEKTKNDGKGVQPSATPTVSEIVEWSKQEENINKFPYKFQDFAFCKYWQKIPNNYLITLRRYPYPVNDAVDLGKDTLQFKSALRPVSTMVTWLGEATGNPITNILGPIETSLRWGEAKADVWQVTTTKEPGGVNNPAPQAAKVLAALQGGLQSLRKKPAPMMPPDPYSNGPYANKVYGPVNVIDKVKKRERGMDFKHSINLVFEYVARPYGGINTKAAALDILGNILLTCSATAPFWGGVNRFMPTAGQGTGDPFLGGPAGRKAWIQANPEKFLSALQKQFTDIYDNIKGIFEQLMGNPIEGLRQLAKDGAKDFMKYSTTDARSMVQGIRSLLTGEPVGEWHVMVGAPHNPIMMIGNLICTNCKIEFGNELGPDDFPLEIKATITLEHGMPRDRAAIESMFNKGRGRIYALPKGYEESFSSVNETKVDKATGKKLGERLKQIEKALVGSRKTALYGLGFDNPEKENKSQSSLNSPAPTIKQTNKNNAAVPKPKK